MPGNRRHIHPEIKKKMVELSVTHTQGHIARLLGVDRKTVNRVINIATRTGKVVQIPPVCGRPRILNGLQLAVSFLIFSMWHGCSSFLQFLEGLIERSPDIYISELRDELERAFDEVVCRSTVVYALKCRGFTRKKVSDRVSFYSSCSFGNPTTGQPRCSGARRIPARRLPALYRHQFPRRSACIC